MINEKGYALITVTFIMISFLSVLLLAFYALVEEGKLDSTQYIIERNDYRWRKAVFGGVVDQSGAKLTRCGGYVSDCAGLATVGGTAGSIGHNVISARLYAPNVATGIGGGWTGIQVPPVYKFSGKAFWEGYWGKRYIQVLPSDDWHYYACPPLKPWPYHPFYLVDGTYARPSMFNICTGKCSFSNTAKGPGWRIRHYKKELEVKDYSPQNGHELRFVLAGHTEVRIDYLDSKICFSDYCLYTVHLGPIGDVDSNTAGVGEKKIMIQVNDNPSHPDSPWITRDTKIMIFPINTGAKSNRIYRMNFYG